MVRVRVKVRISVRITKLGISMPTSIMQHNTTPVALTHQKTEGKR